MRISTFVKAFAASVLIQVIVSACIVWLSKAAFFTSRPAGSRDVALAGSHGERPESDLVYETGGFGWMATIVPVRPAIPIDYPATRGDLAIVLPSVEEWRVGWPLFGFEGVRNINVTSVNGTNCVTARAEWLVEIRKRSYSDYSAVPIAPYGVRWPGMIENTLLTMVVILAIVKAGEGMRRFIRSKRGRCRECGYTVSYLTSDLCPECGSLVNKPPSLEFH